MTLRHRAIPRTGLTDRADPSYAADGPLAGSATVWFDSVAVLTDGVMTEGLFYSELTDVVRSRLSDRRPDICGLSLDRPRIMGILNVTPDSFSDGGQFSAVENAVKRAVEMAQFADILDIGGESTRPGAATVPVAEEIHRTAPVIRAIRAAGITTPISIDTRKSAVAAAALAAGADMVNDVSGLTYDPAMAGLVADAGVPVCIMHAQGDPATMQVAPHYADVVQDVFTWFETRLAAAEMAGIRRANIILDPGIGFGKTLQHNLSILRQVSLYHDLGLPLLLGASRKGFIGKISGAAQASDRMPGSVAVALHGVAQGVQILRVHDVAETRQALSLQQAIDGTTEHDA